MAQMTSTRRVVPQASLHEYFLQEVETAVHTLDVDTTREAVRYLGHLLASFTRTDRLFERTADGVCIRPLAEWYAEAQQAPSLEQRHQALRRLGDVALFVSGVLSQSLRRKPVDVGYYIAMGEGAYGYLSTSPAVRGGDDAHPATFAELAEKFPSFVDVLGEVGECHAATDEDILRAYEQWMRTGSAGARRRLRRAGIVPIAAGASHTRH